MLDLDAPYWFQLPHYFDRTSAGYAGFESNMVVLPDCMRYAHSGGESGRLFPARPHEVVRYARLLQKKGLI